MKEHDIEQRSALSDGVIEHPMTRRVQYLAAYVEAVDDSDVRCMRLALANALAERGHGIRLADGRAGYPPLLCAQQSTG